MTYQKTFTAFLLLLVSIPRNVDAAEIQRPWFGYLLPFYLENPYTQTNGGYNNFSGLDFRRKILPVELSYANLSNVNFTGKNFGFTKFQGANMQGANLENTTCDYLLSFKKCLEKWKRSNRLSQPLIKIFEGITEQIKESLESIKEVYPTLRSNGEKAALLEIASTLAYMPSCAMPIIKRDQQAFFICFSYWACKLLLLKKELGRWGSQLICPLEEELEINATDYCWQTDYSPHLEHSKALYIASQWCRSTTSICIDNSVASLIQQYAKDEYLIYSNLNEYNNLFQKGAERYTKPSLQKEGYGIYKVLIEKSIAILQEVYTRLTSTEAQIEAIDIALSFSEAYKKGHLDFLLHFLSCKNRLIKLIKTYSYAKEGHTWLWYQVKLGALLRNGSTELSDMDYKAGLLPRFFLNADLSKINFRFQNLVYINFSDLNMQGVNLDDTTCDYLQCLCLRVKAYTYYDNWLVRQLSKSLASIADLYPNLPSNSDKAALLKIASAFAYLPSDYLVPVYNPDENEDYIRLGYWSCKLLLLKKKLGALGNQLVCPLEKHLEENAATFCWKTDYTAHLEHPKAIYIASQWCRSTTSVCLKNNVPLLIQQYIQCDYPIYTKIGEYREYFKDEVKRYVRPSLRKEGYDFYKGAIEDGLYGLDMIY
ncbi:MAG: pentapeptide repeat-containing protein [Bacteroidota bacterium]